MDFEVQGSKFRSASTLQCRAGFKARRLLRLRVVHCVMAWIKWFIRSPWLLQFWLQEEIKNLALRAKEREKEKKA